MHIEREVRSMAANKFATMLHRNTNKMTVILVYALLEWILIALLLLNSLLSYLIVKFADYFGLKRPCLWCSRLDHVFEPQSGHNSHRDLLCEAHANEISNLHYCLSHRRLAEKSGRMCEDCSSDKFDIFPWTKEIAVEEDSINCCCGARFSDKRFYHILIKPSSYDRPAKILGEDEEQSLEENRGQEEDIESEKLEEEGNGNEVETRHLEFYIGEEDCTLIPLEEEEKKKKKKKNAVEGTGFGSEDVVLDFYLDANAEAPVETVATDTWCGLGETLEFVPLRAEEAEFDMFKPVLFSQGTQTVSDDDDNGDDIDDDDDYESDADGIDLQSDEIDGEISIGTEIPDHEPIDENEIENQHVDTSFNLCSRRQGDPNSPINLNIHENHYMDQSEQELLVEFKPTLLVQTSLRECIDEEDKVLDTPSSIDSLLHKKFGLRSMEDSLDGMSVMSDAEGGETVEKLKTALKTERKVLGTLYSELEEERSASAEAARQTMAMINRLQEEKAAMQMEAVQYQRMMEEQSEYDQEALQMLNELMIKRENERKELEKEVELYKRKVEEMTRTRTIRRRNSSASTSNEEESEELYTSDGDGQNTPEEAVLYLEESLSGFEEERLSILDQLRVLEEKLFTLTDNDDNDNDSDHADHTFRKNGNGTVNGNGYYHERPNGIANGHSKEMNENHDDGDGDGDDHGGIMEIQAKKLLPFFYAEAEDGIANGNGGCHEYIGSVFEFEEKRSTVEEEVDRVYERLQALEADREFLRHCISSLKKGDKGLCLLREILEHLRDLRSVESRVNNTKEDGVF